MFRNLYPHLTGSSWCVWVQNCWLYSRLSSVTKVFYVNTPREEVTKLATFNTTDHSYLLKLHSSMALGIHFRFSLQVSSYRFPCISFTSRHWSTPAFGFGISCFLSITSLMISSISWLKILFISWWLFNLCLYPELFPELLSHTSNCCLAWIYDRHMKHSLSWTKLINSNPQNYFYQISPFPFMLTPSISFALSHLWNYLWFLSFFFSNSLSVNIFIDSMIKIYPDSCHPHYFHFCLFISNHHCIPVDC